MAQSRELIEAARQVIAEHGYTAASLRRVAEHLGRTTGSVTYYFASKEEMIASVAASLFDDFEEALDRCARVNDFQRMFDFLTEWEKPRQRCAWLVWFHLLPHAATDPVLAPLFRERNTCLRAKFTAVIARYQRQGVVRSDFPADLLTDQLSAMSDGWVMMGPVEPSRFKPARIKELIKLSIAMLAPPD